MKPASNGLGMAGLIVSIVGTLMCGILAPIGLILSLVGLRKEPRGLAIAGSVIGLLGSGFLVFMGIGIVKGFLGLKAAVGNIATEVQSHEAAQKILKEKKRTGSLPSESVGNALISAEKDAWQHPLRYKPSGTTFKIVSDGPDGKADTSDDLSFTEEDLRATTEPSEMDGESADPDESDGGPDEATPAAKPAPVVKPKPAPAKTVTPRTTTPKTGAPRTTTPKPAKPPATTSEDGL
jgi:hypothetical protein